MTSAGSRVAFCLYERDLMRLRDARAFYAHSLWGNQAKCALVVLAHTNRVKTKRVCARATSCAHKSGENQARMCARHFLRTQTGRKSSENKREPLLAHTNRVKTKQECARGILAHTNRAKTKRECARATSCAHKPGENQARMCASHF